jgi:hypothetical protein
MERMHPALAPRWGKEEPMRWPDAYQLATAATVLNYEYNVASNADGDAVFAVHHSLSNSKATYVVTAGTLAAAPTYAVHPQYTAMNAESIEARTTHTKVTVMYVGAALDAAGYLSFMHKRNLTEISSKAIGDVHTASLRQVRAQEGLEIHLSPTADPDMISVAGLSFMQNVTPIAVFAASGLPASKSVFRVSITQWIEYLPVEGSLSEGEQVHEPHSPAALSVLAELSGPHTSVMTHAEKPSFLQRAAEVANAAYHMAQPVAEYFAPKARQYLMDNFTAALPLLLAA